jgi:hypothetical protein
VSVGACEHQCDLITSSTSRRASSKSADRCPRPAASGVKTGDYRAAAGGGVAKLCLRRWPIRSVRPRTLPERAGHKGGWQRRAGYQPTRVDRGDGAECSRPPRVATLASAFANNYASQIAAGDGRGLFHWTGEEAGLSSVVSKHRYVEPRGRVTPHAVCQVKDTRAKRELERITRHLATSVYRRLASRIELRPIRKPG